jgi:hypothetical protein
MQFGFAIMHAVLKRQSKFSNVLKSFFTLKRLSFSLSVGVFSGVYKLLLCVLRRLRGKDDFWNTILSSSLASFAILLDREESRRMNFIYIILCRSFENSKNIVCSKTKRRAISKFEVLILCLMGIFMWYFYSIDSTVIS